MNLGARRCARQARGPRAPSMDQRGSRHATRNGSGSRHGSRLHLARLGSRTKEHSVIPPSSPANASGTSDSADRPTTPALAAADHRVCEGLVMTSATHTHANHGLPMAWWANGQGQTLAPRSGRSRAEMTPKSRHGGSKPAQTAPKTCRNCRSTPCESEPSRIRRQKTLALVPTDAGRPKQRAGTPTSENLISSGTIGVEDREGKEPRDQPRNTRKTRKRTGGTGIGGSQARPGVKDREGKEPRDQPRNTRKTRKRMINKYPPHMNLVKLIRSYNHFCMKINRF